jgi:hypothetical protein
MKMKTKRKKKKNQHITGGIAHDSQLGIWVLTLMHNQWLLPKEKKKKKKKKTC